jgi:hypothetical protein
MQTRCNVRVAALSWEKGQGRAARTPRVPGPWGSGPREDTRPAQRSKSAKLIPPGWPELQAGSLLFMPGETDKTL